MLKIVSKYNSDTKRILSDVTYYKSYLHTFYFDESKELLDHINIMQLKVFQFLSRVRRSKFVRDGLPVEQAAEYADNFIRNFHDKERRARRSFMVSNMNNVTAGNIEIPNYEPINLTKSNCELSEGLISLCSKGPSFVPTPNTFDWRQLQIDFDKFKNTLRKISFSSINEAGSSTNKNTTLPLTIDNPPRKQSLWIPPKSNSNEIETFISLVEKDLFQDTSRKRIPSNLSEDEKKALKDWRKNVLFNKESDKMMRLQDKGNRFIIVDKQ